MAIDTYYDHSATVTEIVRTFVTSGRYVTAFFLGVMYFLGVSTMEILFVSACIGVISLSVTILVLFCELKNKIKDDILRYVLSVIVIICPFMIEPSFYLEKGIMCLGLLFAMIAIKFFNKAIRQEKIFTKNLLISLLFGILSCNCYQSMWSCFIVLGILLIAVDFKKAKIKTSVINIVKCEIVYVLAMGVDLFLAKLEKADKEKIEMSADLITTIKNILIQSENTFNFYNIVPLWFVFLIIAGVAIVLNVRKMTKKH